MSMQLTFTGETLKDVLSQIAALTVAVSGVPAIEPLTVDATPISREVERADAETTRDAATDIELPETAVNPLSAEDIAKLKEKALEKGRDVYASGPEGQAKVKVILAKYGVKKGAQVPDERVSEFYDDVMGL